MNNEKRVITYIDITMQDYVNKPYNNFCADRIFPEDDIYSIEDYYLDNAGIVLEQNDNILYRWDYSYIDENGEKHIIFICNEFGEV